MLLFCAAFLDVPRVTLSAQDFRSSHRLELDEGDEAFELICEADANPGAHSIHWKKNVIANKPAKTNLEAKFIYYTKLFLAKICSQCLPISGPFRSPLSL